MYIHRIESRLPGEARHGWVFAWTSVPLAVGMARWGARAVLLMCCGALLIVHLQRDAPALGGADKGQDESVRATAVATVPVRPLGTSSSPPAVTSPAKPCDLSNCSRLCGHSQLNPCVRGCQCPAPQCVLRRRECVESPYVPTPDGGPWECRFGQDAPSSAAVPVENVAKDFLDSAQWLFARSDVERPLAMSAATCGAADGERRFAGRHEADGIFTLRNFCVQPSGPCAGFRPVFPVVYRGKWEVEVIRKDSANETRLWLQNPAALREPATCYHDQPTFIFPVSWKADNAMHMLHRLLTARRMMRRRFGDDAFSKVLVIYLVHPSGAKDLRKRNALAFMQQWLSRKWVSVQSDSADVVPNQQQLCFAEAAVLHMCVDRCHVPSHFVPRGNDYYFTWMGPRTAADAAEVADLRKLVARCVGLLPLPELERAKPRIVFVWRTLNRRHFAMAALADAIAAHATTLGASSFHIVEHTQMRDSAALRLYMRADVVVGHIGAGLLWSLLMPPGGVVVEFAHAFGCSAGKSGWNVATECDYGGNAAAARLQHLSVPIPKYAAANRTGFYVPLSVYKSVLDAAFCRLRGGGGCGVGVLRYVVGWDRELAFT